MDDSVWWTDEERRGGSTVSRESAPSLLNSDSPLTRISSGSASCFFTMAQTFASVSGLAWTWTIEGQARASDYYFYPVMAKNYEADPWRRRIFRSLISADLEEQWILGPYKI